MADLATLKSRIASEIHRSDLTSAIAYAIGDAVKQYQSRRFAFNQTRGTFSTAVGTEFYDSLTDIASIDTVTMTVNGRKVVLDEWPYGYMERINTTTNTNNQPWAWSWYDEKIRLYPIPDAVYPMTVSYVQKVDVPSTDGASNIWTTEAEELIRHAAKKRIYRDVTMDDSGAMKAEMAEAEQLARLTKDSNRLAAGGLRGSM